MSRRRSFSVSRNCFISLVIVLIHIVIYSFLIILFGLITYLEDLYFVKIPLSGIGLVVIYPLRIIMNTALFIVILMFVYKDVREIYNKTIKKFSLR
jgi:hypothetical protein